MSARKKYSQPKNIYLTDTSSMMYMLFIDLECKNGLLDGNEKDRGDIQKNRYDRNSALKINCLIIISNRSYIYKHFLILYYTMNMLSK